MIWAGLLTAASEQQLDLSADLAGWVGIPEGYVQLIAPLVIALALWLIARASPRLVEQVLLGVAVDGQAYEKGGNVIAGSVKVPSERVVVIDGAAAAPAAAVDAMIATAALADVARARLTEYLNGRG